MKGRDILLLGFPSGKELLPSTPEGLSIARDHFVLEGTEYRAKGDAARFLSLYQAYVRSQDVTRRRLYLEAIRDVFPKLGNKYIIDSDQKNMLPFLNLGQTKEGGKP